MSAKTEAVFGFSAGSEPPGYREPPPIPSLGIRFTLANLRREYASREKHP
jgi:hypothetical protein